MAKVSFEYRDWEPIIKGDFEALRQESVKGNIPDGPANVIIWLASVLIRHDLVKVEPSEDELEGEEDDA